MSGALGGAPARRRSLVFNALRILLGWSGRIGRRTWLGGLAFLSFLYPILAALAMAAAPSPREAALIFVGAAALALWIVFVLAAKRLRDTGRSPLWALAPFAPLAVMTTRLPPYAVLALRRGDFEAFAAVFVVPDPLFSVALILQSVLAVWLLLWPPSPRAQGPRLAFLGGQGAARSASPWGATDAPPTAPHTPRPPTRAAPPAPATRGSGLPRRDGPVIDRRG
jgi:uncharacterized membrane protein YhaH (DUF805 family)